MDVPKTMSELTAILDTRYKQTADCEKDMDAVNEKTVKMLVDVELIKQQLKIIKWVACTTLAAVIASVVALVLK